MAQMINGTSRQGVKRMNKAVWLRAAGAIILLGAGILLYRKKQKAIGSTLISGSVKLLTDMGAPATA
jgi:LPXTG-motif cell wall-anchored protein